MTTNLPDAVQETLTTVGQVAAELPCQVDGYREFVSVFRFQTSRIMGFASQYPYLGDHDIAYRLMRFKLDADLIEDDHDFNNNDLVGLQSIYVSNERNVMDILKMWAVSPELLRQPRDTDVPI